MHPLFRDILEAHGAPKARKVVTDYVYPPIPTRDFDWQATWDDYDPDPECSRGQNVGWGRTEAEAVADLYRETEDSRDAVG
jgi:hypothetical protein